MYGAILGDIVGSPYEFNRGNKTKDFPLFSNKSEYTDDTVMTIAVAEALLDADDKSDEEVKTTLVHSMQKWGRAFPYAGYGDYFKHWIKEADPKPYNSYGNGAAMRVSAVGWTYDSLEKTRHIARLTAEVSHNHPEGLKGAESVAATIFLARTEHSKEKIRAYITDNFGYDLSKTCDEIRPRYVHTESCQRSVPEAIIAFLESTDYEDAIRTAISLGGDCDTQACIAGSIAEAFYGMPNRLIRQCKKRMEPDMLLIVRRWEEKIGRKPIGHLEQLSINCKIKAAKKRREEEHRIYG